MSQGIVKVTPKPGVAGQLVVIVVDLNLYGVRVGDTLSFPDPGTPLSEWDIVDCTITSRNDCNGVNFPAAHVTTVAMVP